MTLLKVPHMKWLILVDMDGVIADFRGYCSKIFQRDLKSRPGAISDQLGGLSDQEFWNSCPDDIFRRLDPTPDAVNLVNYLESLPPTDYEWMICTSPGSKMSASADKLIWLNEHFRIKKQVLFTHDKTSFAHRPKTVLIDDDDPHPHTEHFTAQGGIGLLFPRPWNGLSWSSGDVHNPVLKIKRDISQLIWSHNILSKGRIKREMAGVSVADMEELLEMRKAWSSG